jgi:hypothetical protein
VLDNEYNPNPPEFRAFFSVWIHMTILFSNKVYPVTGGASGMGEAIVHYLAQHGAQVVLADINEEAT